MRFNLMLFKEIPARQVFDFSFVNTRLPKRARV